MRGTRALVGVLLALGWEQWEQASPAAASAASAARPAAATLPGARGRSAADAIRHLEFRTRDAWVRAGR